MAGGGGNRGFYTKDPDRIVEKLRELEKNTEDHKFSSRVAEALGELLSKYNDRDIPKVNARLDNILDCLNGMFETEIRTLFGGSVAKHTYVDGLSDIDCLLVIDENERDLDPEKILNRISSKLKDRLKDCTVSHGRIAITIEFEDGMSIQLLPAIKGEKSLKVPSWIDNRWSRINPEKFQEKLSKVNEICSGKLIPTVKLVKAINDSMPEKFKLTGYHIESMAIDIFKNYSGEKSTTAMTEHFYEKAVGVVLNPITDSSKQSIHVDEYLGAPNSEQRVQASQLIDRVSRRIKNANARKSIDSWTELFRGVE